MRSLGQTLEELGGHLLAGKLDGRGLRNEVMEQLREEPLLCCGRRGGGRGIWVEVVGDYIAYFGVVTRNGEDLRSRGFLNWGRSRLSLDPRRVPEVGDKRL